MTDSQEATTPSAGDTPAVRTWLAPAVLALFLVIAGGAAAAGVAIGMRASTDSARDLCTRLATALGTTPGKSVKDPRAALVALEVDRNGMKKWTCVGATSAPAKNGGVTVTGFRFTVTRDGGGWDVEL